MTDYKQLRKSIDTKTQNVIEVWGADTKQILEYIYVNSVCSGLVVIGVTGTNRVIKVTHVFCSHEISDSCSGGFRHANRSRV